MTATSTAHAHTAAQIAKLMPRVDCCHAGGDLGAGRGPVSGSASGSASTGCGAINPDRSSGGKSRRRSRRRRYTAMPAAVHASVTLRLRVTTATIWAFSAAEPALAHEDQPRRLDDPEHAEDPGVEHGGVVRCVPGVDPALAARGRGFGGAPRSGTGWSP